MADESPGVSMGGATCTRETAKAILVVMTGGKEEWIPQKAVHDDSEVWRKGQAGKLVVARWFARMRGWED
jgi:hypothetical protein